MNTTRHASEITSSFGPYSLFIWEEEGDIYFSVSAERMGVAVSTNSEEKQDAKIVVALRNKDHVSDDGIACYKSTEPEWLCVLSASRDSLERAKKYRKEHGDEIKKKAYEELRQNAPECVIDDITLDLTESEIIADYVFAEKPFPFTPSMITSMLTSDLFGDRDKIEGDSLPRAGKLGFVEPSVTSGSCTVELKTMQPVYRAQSKETDSLLWDLHLFLRKVFIELSNVVNEMRDNGSWDSFCFQYFRDTDHARRLMREKLRKEGFQVGRRKKFNARLFFKTLIVAITMTAAVVAGFTVIQKLYFQKPQESAVVIDPSSVPATIRYYDAALDSAAEAVK